MRFLPGASLAALRTSGSGGWQRWPRSAEDFMVAAALKPAGLRRLMEDLLTGKPRGAN